MTELVERQLIEAGEESDWYLCILDGETFEEHSKRLPQFRHRIDSIPTGEKAGVEG